MNNLNYLIEEKTKEIARKHAEIIERECEQAILRYKCLPEELIIKYHADTSIEINIKASHFKISNEFVINDDKKY